MRAEKKKVFGRLPTVKLLTMKLLTEYAVEGKEVVPLLELRTQPGQVQVFGEEVLQKSMVERIQTLSRDLAAV